jgi:hypothetical protein
MFSPSLNTSSTASKAIYSISEEVRAGYVNSNRIIERQMVGLLKYWVGKHPRLPRRRGNDKKGRGH